MIGTPAFPKFSPSSSSTSACPIQFPLLFLDEPELVPHNTIVTQGASRNGYPMAGADRVLSDKFNSIAASCCFLRLAGGEARVIHLELPGDYRLQSCAGGGWLLEPQSKGFFYWVPQPIMLRRVSQNGHLSEERTASVSSLRISGSSSRVELEIPVCFVADLVAWQIPSEEKNLINGVMQMASVESQKIFLWGSHTIYQRPADLYRHLIFGHVYEDRFAWPYNRKICSENDAHALYVTLSGLQRATGKKLYALLKEQLLLSVLARQSSDGGWHHGEWTDDMEAHLRLNGSAIHLLMDSLVERDDPHVKQALERAVSFVTRHRDEMRVGTWFLHDALELSAESMKKSPSRWTPSTTFGKSPSNMLVLNTHLDTTVLLDRYRQVTGNDRAVQLLESARQATRTVLNSQPVEWFYRVLFRLIHLTLLPTHAAKDLPMPVRALKRIAWKWLIPNLHHVKRYFPRLVMPGGYIDRALCLTGLADPYLSINVMDLARYWRRFSSEDLGRLMSDAVKFVNDHQLQDHWAERQEKKYALGFWAEALYHLYTLKPDESYRRWLGETMLKLADAQLGLPPSLLGANAEAVSLEMQVPCPSVADARLRVANLSRASRSEFLVVNPTHEALPLIWEDGCAPEVIWESGADGRLAKGDSIQVPSRGWLYGRKAIAAEIRLPCVSGL